MSYDDSAHWHCRAQEMLARAEQMNECVTKQVLRRVADAYAGLARKAEEQAEQSPPNPVSTTLKPAEARQFPPRKDRLIACVRQMDECASELLRCRVADAGECLTQIAEPAANRLPSIPVSRALIVPTEVRHFAPRKGRAVLPLATVPGEDIPSFLRRGPRAEEERNFRAQILGIAAGRLRQMSFFKLPKFDLAKDHEAVSAVAPLWSHLVQWVQGRGRNDVSNHHQRDHSGKSRRLLLSYKAD
jgi:hypothetical protein